MMDTSALGQMSWNPVTWTRGIMGGFTDWLGLTDTAAPGRGYNAMKSRANDATKQLNSRMAPVMNMYQDAMTGNEMGDVIDDYTGQMMRTENAADSSNVEKFMNPMYDRAMDSAANQALAGAGSSLQSSGANNAVANAVANESTQMWNQAFQDALADAENKQGVYDDVFNSRMMPSQQWAQLTSDMAGTEYTKNMDVAQAAGQTAGQNRSWFGNLF